MKALNMAQLTEAAQRMAKKQGQQKKARYHLAKELGFSPSEAVILQNRKEETIRRLAQEKNTH